MHPRLADALGTRLGAAVTAARPVAGGDINDAFDVRLADGRHLFVKTNARAPVGMFQAEAGGLAWLAEADAIRVPHVLAVSDRDDERAQYLALEFLADGPRAAGFEAQLGRALASLHRAGAPGFGLATDNFIGSLPQVNTRHGTWQTFYAACRLLPQARRAIDAGRAPATWAGRFDRLCARLGDLAGPDEPPARLHGDLWSGNVMTDEAGGPVVIDPAVYGGHREVDLAMLRLFGHPGPRLFAAYDEVWPLAEGHDERVALYQLYPLLVHVNLFGGSYTDGVDAALRRYE